MGLFRSQYLHKRCSSQPNGEFYMPIMRSPIVFTWPNPPMPQKVYLVKG